MSEWKSKINGMSKREWQRERKSVWGWEFKRLVIKWSNDPVIERSSNRVIKQLSDQLIEWLINGASNWVIDWLIDWLSDDWLSDSLSKNDKESVTE